MRLEHLLSGAGKHRFESVNKIKCINGNQINVAENISGCIFLLYYKKIKQEGPFPGKFPGNIRDIDTVSFLEHQRKASFVIRSAVRGTEQSYSSVG